MPLFSVPIRNDRAQDTKVLHKLNAKAKSTTVTIRDGGGIAGRIANINAMVSRNLGQYESESIVIRDENELHRYISKAIENNLISIDTETNGLDPMLDDIVGVCIYTVDEKTAYIPINHISYITLEKVPNQLSRDVVAKELQRIVDAKTFTVMFNAKFDIRVMRNQLGVYMKCNWDCYLAARLLNENEGAGNNGLKKLHQKYVRNGEGDAFSFDNLFNGIPFSQIPIKTGYLYARHDALVTYELYKFQSEYLGENAKEYGLEGVAWVFHNIEMPCVEVCCDMEDNGITFDFDYANELSIKYNKLLDEKLAEFYKTCDSYSDLIERYKSTHPNHKLDNPINIGSSQQIGVLIYDILGITPPDAKNPRGTGADILSSIEHPIAKVILEYRNVQKLISTYIDKLPNCVNPNDNRIHCNFNQYGADTGRFSSSEPNLNLWACM